MSSPLQRNRQRRIKQRKKRFRERRRREERERKELMFMEQMSMFMILFMFVCDGIQYMFGGNKGKELPRERKDLKKDIINPLGKYYFRRAYRMDVSSFFKLHSLLEQDLIDHYFPYGGGKRDPKQCKYTISTDIRLSIAIRYFAGACPYDLMVSHGVSFTSVYTSVWGVVDAVNKCNKLKFEFPNHDEQRSIANGFQKMSGAGFNQVVGAIDGLLIWILKPSACECKKLKVAGNATFRCHRKDKYGMNLQAICDHRLKFIWADIQWPGATSDYMAWVTSDLHHDMEDSSTNILLPGMTIIGDNAYVKKPYMAVPFKGRQDGHKDGYNFYLSQLRITIERCFGVFVHRWSVLRGPLAVPLKKVGPFVKCLMRLHNYCIDEKELKITSTTTQDAVHLQSVISYSNIISNGGSDQEAVRLDDHGRPVSLIDQSNHFNDAPSGRRPKVGNEYTPMDTMLMMVREQGFKWYPQDRCLECKMDPCEKNMYFDFLTRHMQWQKGLTDKHHEEWRTWFKESYRFIKDWELYSCHKKIGVNYPQVYAHCRTPRCMLEAFDQFLHDIVEVGEGQLPLGLETGDQSEVMSDDSDGDDRKAAKRRRS